MNHETLERRRRRRNYLAINYTWRLAVFAAAVGLISLTQDAAIFQQQTIARLPDAYSIVIFGTTWIVFVTMPLAITAVIFLCAAKTRVPGLDYVPPVSEPMPEQPAERILVRASVRPATSAAELLRATCSETKTAAGELLRPHVILH